MRYGTGASVDGTMRSVGAFDEQGLVRMPLGLSFVEAATLSFAGVTAWNALFGLPGRSLMAGQWVLTQGTGVVSIFATEFAKAIEAQVIAATSYPEEVKILESLGSDHVIRYRETVNWGTKARESTGGEGVDLVVEVAGPRTLQESVESAKLDGTITLIPFRVTMYCTL